MGCALFGGYGEGGLGLGGCAQVRIPVHYSVAAALGGWSGIMRLAASGVFGDLDLERA